MEDIDPNEVGGPSALGVPDAEIASCDRAEHDTTTTNASAGNLGDFILICMIPVDAPAQRDNGMVE
jgi:hypothetical protein